MTSPDILLVQPPHGKDYSFWKSESLGMGCLASALETAGFRVRILDAFLDPCSVADAASLVLEAPPRLLLGLSMLSYESFRSGEELLGVLRSHGFDRHVTVGSWFPTFWYDAMIAESPAFDSVVAGEGERAICWLAQAVETGDWRPTGTIAVQQVGNVHVIRDTSPPVDLDDLPDPRHDHAKLAFERFHLAMVQTSRGCGHSRCTFCSVPLFYEGSPRHRTRSPERVVAELERLAGDGVDFVFFADEDFLGPLPEGGERALEILETAHARGVRMRYAFNCPAAGVDRRLFSRLKELGLAAVYIGVESGLDRQLKLYGKSVSREELNEQLDVLDNLGIKLVPGWIMFDPAITLDEVELQLDFLGEMDAHHVNYLKSLYVMRGTPLERHYRGQLFRTPYEARYYFSDPRVDLLVRILLNEYLPETQRSIAQIYPVWHRLLADYCDEEQQAEYERINREIRELQIGFVREVVARLRVGSLDGLTHVMTDHVDRWQRLGGRIDALDADISGRDANRVGRG